MTADSPQFPPDLARYHRQAILPGVGVSGQRRLLASHALIVGCGALGTAVADALCRAGVGTLTIVDRDYVELTNLQRQTLFDESDAAAATPKAEAARERLAKVNSTVRVNAIVDDFNHRNAERLASGADVLIDGTDNFETRYLLNDLAVKLGLPYIYGGVVGTTGMQMSILPRDPAGAPRPWASHETPCLRCVFEQAPPAGSAATCDTAGVLGPAVSIVAAFEAAEAIKALLGAWSAVSRSLLSFDIWTNELRRIDMSGALSNDCPCCARAQFPHLSGESASQTATLCGRSSVQILPPAQNSRPLDLPALAAKLAPHGRFTASRFMLKGVFDRERAELNEPIELALFPDGRAIVKGTMRPETARSIYARYIGA